MPTQLHNEDPFRVAVLHSQQENSVILKHDLRLPSGEQARGESFEETARRIAKDAFDLEYLTAVVRIPPVEGVEGYVLEAATGQRTDLRRSFAGRAFELDFILQNAQRKPGMYLQSDINILRAYKAITLGANQ